MLKRLKTHVKNIAQPQIFIDYAQERLSGLTKLLRVKDGIKWNLRLSKEGGVRKGEIYHAEAQLKTAKKNFGAQADGETPYQAIDQVRDELDRKITRYGDKRDTLMKKGGRLAKRLLKRG